MEYKINTLLPIQFEKIENPPYLNDSRYQAVRVYVAHEFENYNGSYFDLSVLESMGKRMAGVPIVGYISANNINEKDFLGHEQRLIVDDNGVSVEYLGRAYGCVLSNEDVTIVDKMHEDGKLRKYLCATGVLWKMFTDCVDIFERDTQKSHSMELQEGSMSGKFEKDGYFHFDDATVRALCVLGDGIMPAMSNSIIEKFSQKEFECNVQELLNEVNESIKQFTKSQNNIDPLNSKEMEQSVFNIDSIDKGGKQKLDEKKELISKYGLTLEQLDFSIEEISLEDLEVKLKEFTAKPEENFSLSNNQLRSEVDKTLQGMTEIRKNYWGDLVEVNIYYLLDLKDSYAIVANYDWDTYFGIPYTVNGDTVTLDFEAKVEFVPDWRPKENGVDSSLFTNIKEIITTEFSNVKESTNTQINKLQSDLDTITIEYEKVKPEYERLQEFESTALVTERKEAEDALFEEFKDLDGNEEYEELKKQTSEYELEILSEKCFAIRGKKNSKFSIKASTKKVKIEFSKKENESEGEFDNLFEKYLK